MVLKNVRALAARQTMIPIVNFERLNRIKDEKIGWIRTSCAHCSVEKMSEHKSANANLSIRRKDAELNAGATGTQTNTDRFFGWRKASFGPVHHGGLQTLCRD
jgi:hypothetical protein